MQQLPTVATVCAQPCVDPVGCRLDVHRHSGLHDICGRFRYSLVRSRSRSKVCLVSPLMLFAQSAGSDTVFGAAGIVVVVLLAAAAGGYRLLKDASNRLTKQIDKLDSRLTKQIDKLDELDKQLSGQIGELRGSLSGQIGELRGSLNARPSPRDGEIGAAALREAENKLVDRMYEYGRFIADPQTHYVYLRLHDDTVELTEGGRLEIVYKPPDAEPDAEPGTPHGD